MPDSTTLPPEREPRWSYARGYCAHHGRVVFRAPSPLDPLTAGACVHCQPPAQDLAAAAVPEPEQTPPAIPLAVEAAEPADATVDGSSARVSEGNGLAKVFGKWPGNETDAELIEALREDSSANEHDRGRCNVCAASGHPQRDERGRLLGAPELSASERPVVRDPLLRAFEEDGIVQPASASVAAVDVGPARTLCRDIQQAVWRQVDGKTTAEAYGVELLRISNALATESVRVRGRG